MAKFFGVIGYGHSVQTRPGVWQDIITEHTAYGDVKRNSRQLREGEFLNDDMTVGNSIEIVADAYANEQFHAIKFVEWAGALWKVEDVTVMSPRLLLRLGGVYHGPRAAV